MIQPSSVPYISTFRDQTTDRRSLECCSLFEWIVSYRGLRTFSNIILAVWFSIDRPNSHKTHLSASVLERHPENHYICWHILEKRMIDSQFKSESCKMGSESLFDHLGSIPRSTRIRFPAIFETLSWMLRQRDGRASWQNQSCHSNLFRRDRRFKDS
jgi:hypothetical protein